MAVAVFTKGISTGNGIHGRKNEWIYFIYITIRPGRPTFSLANGNIKYEKLAPTLRQKNQYL
jgi:hypothetical protein